jgi:hypothetical protein
MRARLIAALLALTIAAPAAAGVPVWPGGLTEYVFVNDVSPSPAFHGIEATFINSSAADSAKNFGACDTLFWSSSSYTGPYRAGRNTILLYCDWQSWVPPNFVAVQAYWEIFQLEGGTGVLSDSASVHLLFPSFEEGDECGVASTDAATWHTRRRTKITRDGNETNARWATPGAEAVNTGSALASYWSDNDSTVARTWIGSDSTDAKSSANSYDRSNVPYARLFPKTGAAATNRRGWLGIPYTHPFNLVQSGARTNNGAALRISNLGNKRWLIADDDFPDALYRITFRVAGYVIGDAVAGGGSSSGGLSGGGIGFRP